MSYSRVELVAQRRQTLGMIRADPTSIVLTRRAKSSTPTATGGFTRDSQVLDPQVFKFIKAGMPQISHTPTIGGVEQQTQDQLLGRWDADVRPGDTFEIGDDQYEVSEVSDLEYRKVAPVILRENRG